MNALFGAVANLFLCIVYLAGLEICLAQNDVMQSKDYDKIVRTMLSTAQRPGHISELEWELVLNRYKAFMARNQEFLFYGKVIDQNMNPVSDAMVSGFVSSYNPKILANLGTEKEDVYPKWSTRTDSNGVFSVSGLHGYGLSVTNILKQGYRVPEVPFSESFSHPDKPGSTPRTWAVRDTPAVMKVWFDDGVRPGLVEKKVRIRFPHDDIERRIDILKAGQASTNDIPFDIGLRVNLTKGDGDKSGLYRWAFSLNAPGGGLVEREEWTPIKAPEDGYAPSINHEVWESRPWLFGKLYKTYYLRSREGKLYAAITVDFGGDQDGYTDVNVKSVTNPDGSRDLFAPFVIPTPTLR